MKTAVIPARSRQGGLVVGTWPWLVRHDLRLRWRELVGRSGAWRLAVAAGAVLIGILAVLVALAGKIRGKVDLSGPLPPELLLGGTFLVLVLASLMLSQAINESVAALFDRGDLDLLVSSPIPTRVVFAGRAVSVVLSVFFSAALFVVPVALFALLAGIPRLLGLLPALVALAVTTGSLGMLITLGLVRVIGARRTRTVAQVLATIIGAALFLSSQAANFAGPGTARALQDTHGRLLAQVQEGGVLGAASPLWYPARVTLFEPLPVLVVLLAAVALFALTVAVAHGTFVAGTRESVSVKRTRPVDQGGPIRFRSGLLAVTLTKEWRLIYRDPYLISQVLLQVVFMLPLAAVVILGPNRGEGPQMPSFSPAALVAAACAVLGGTLAANLTRITISGEDAPDLLAASPVGAAAFQRAKLLAALLPVWALLAVPVGYVAFSLAPGWWAAILAPAGATVGNALICLSFPVKRPRNELIRRRNQNPLLNLLEGFTYLAWAAAGLGLASGATWGLAGVAAGMVGPGLALWRLSVSKG